MPREPQNLHCRKTSLVAETPGVAGGDGLHKLTFTPYEGGDVLVEIKSLEGFTDDEEPIFTDPQRMIMSLDSLEYVAGWCRAKLGQPV